MVTGTRGAFWGWSGCASQEALHGPLGDLDTWPVSVSARAEVCTLCPRVRTFGGLPGAQRRRGTQWVPVGVGVVEPGEVPVPQGKSLGAGVTSRRPALWAPSTGGDRCMVGIPQQDGLTLHHLEGQWGAWEDHRQCLCIRHARQILPRTPGTEGRRDAGICAPLAMPQAVVVPQACQMPVWECPMVVPGGPQEAAFSSRGPRRYQARTDAQGWDTPFRAVVLNVRACGRIHQEKKFSVVHPLASSDGRAVASHW